MVEEKEFISLTELACLLGVCVQTIHNWRRAGKLPAELKMATHCLRWRKSEIDKWIETNRRQ